MNYFTIWYNDDSGRYVLYMDARLGQFLMGSSVPKPISAALTPLLNGYINPRGVAGVLQLNKDNRLPTNYFTMPTGSKMPLIYSTPDGKEPGYTDDGNIEEDNTRQGIKIGRWIKSLLTEKYLKSQDITDATIEALGKAAAAYCNPTLTLERVNGDDIVRYYREGSYAQKSGTLIKSCMKYENIPAARFRMYTNNPNCSMLVALNEAGRLLGRALVWDNVHVEAHDAKGHPQLAGNITFLDRIYSVDTWVDEAFKRHAKEQGWYRKTHQDAKSAMSVTTPDGGALTATMYVELPFAQEGVFRNGYPYMDTFCYLSRTFDKARNSSSVSCPYLMHDQNGTLGNFQNREGYVFTDIDQWVLAQNLGTCEECRQTGDKRHFPSIAKRPDVQICRNCVNTRYVFSALYHTYMPPEDVVPAMNGHAAFDFVLKEDTVISKYHMNPLIRNEAIKLAVPDDYVLGRLVKLVDSTYHNGPILERDAVLVPFCTDDGSSSYVHKDFLEEAKSRGMDAKKQFIEKKRQFIEQAKASALPAGLPPNMPMALGDVVRLIRQGDGVLPVVLTNVKYDDYRYGSGWAYQYDGRTEWFDAGWFLKVGKGEQVLQALLSELSDDNQAAKELDISQLAVVA